VPALPAPALGLPLPGGPDALQRARQLARDDPKIVANVVKGWVSRDE
jgi:hypothetical protein